MQFEEQWERVVRSARILKVFTQHELLKHSGSRKGTVQKFCRTKCREIGAVSSTSMVASKYQIKEQFDEQVAVANG